MTLFLLLIIALELFFILLSHLQGTKTGAFHLFSFKRDLSRVSDEELEAELARRHRIENLEKEVADLKKEIESLKSTEKLSMIEHVEFQEVSEEATEVKESKEELPDSEPSQEKTDKESETA